METTLEEGGRPVRKDTCSVKKENPKAKTVWIEVPVVPEDGFLVFVFYTATQLAPQLKQRCIQRDNVSAFSYMVRQTNNSGLVSILYMVRQAKSRKTFCLGTQDKIRKMHISQKFFVGFLPNLHQQTRHEIVHLFVYEVIVPQNTP